MSKWLKFFIIMAVLAMVPSVLVFAATLFLKIAAIIVCVGLIILLAVLQIIGKITLRKMLWWIGSIVAIMIIVIWSPWDKNWGEKTVGTRPVTSTVVTNAPQMADWYWSYRSSDHVRGRTESAPNERVVEIVDKTTTTLGFNLYYNEHGSREVCRTRLNKVGAKTWEGIWEQDNPKEHGTVIMDEIAPNIFSGIITGENGEKGRCNLKVHNL